jgi:transcriptional regulator with XRE-family HTH domain
MPPKQPDPTDVHVGARIRAQRLQNGLSQTALAEKLGVTFQQVQKYEKGVNRVGAGRLQKIATELGVPVTAFYEGGPNSGGRKAGSVDAATKLMSTREGVRLARAFPQIANGKLRQTLVQMAEAAAGERSPQRS